MSRSSRLEIGTNQSQYPGWNRPSSEFVIAPGGSWFNRYSKRRREERACKSRLVLLLLAVTCASGLSPVLLLPLLGQHKKKRDLSVYQLTIRSTAKCGALSSFMTDDISKSPLTSEEFTSTTAERSSEVEVNVHP